MNRGTHQDGNALKLIRKKLASQPRPTSIIEASMIGLIRLVDGWGSTYHGMIALRGPADVNLPSAVRWMKTTFMSAVQTILIAQPSKSP